MVEVGGAGGRGKGAEGKGAEGLAGAGGSGSADLPRLLDALLTPDGARLIARAA
ncbi:hypothetical protein I6A84_14785, partial [Frankia sp. CNm7]|nr:hypothetical protein [Frankia nepalensis]